MQKNLKTIYRDNLFNEQRVLFKKVLESTNKLDNLYEHIVVDYSSSNHCLQIY